jgi:hypothetical protein
LTNTFHFDIFTGNFTPIQPYITLLVGLARNNFYDYSAIADSMSPTTFSSGTKNNLAYGANLGLSYQVSKLQVVNCGLDYWSLGELKDAGSNIMGSDIHLTDKNLAVFGLEFSYVLQF